VSSQKPAAADQRNRRCAVPLIAQRNPAALLAVSAWSFSRSRKVRFRTVRSDALPSCAKVCSRLKSPQPHEVHTMATLDEKHRDKLKESQFGLPEERKYPMPDASHARNAKARAAQQVKAGNLTKSEEQKIDRKADRVLNK
jgi:hypothetical protein